MAVLLVHHLRKSSQDDGPLLRDDSRTWIEKIYGSQALIAHSDNIWGLAAEAEGYTFATVPRSHEPVTVRLEKRPDSARFLLSDDKLSFMSSQQRAHWNKLPARFTWGAGLACGVPNSALDRIVRSAKGAGLLYQDSGTYIKRDP